MPPDSVYGRVTALFVQRAPLKPGVAPHRWYDPSPVVAVDGLRVDSAGAQGLAADGAAVPDVHHPDHPLTRNRRGRNALSLLTRADLDALVARFGPRVDARCVAPSILLDTATPGAALLAAGATELVLTTRDGRRLQLSHIRATPPCVEFTRWCLGRAAAPGDGAAGVDDEVADALDWLGGGRRGLYAVPAVSDPVVVRAGDTVTLGALR